MASLEDLLFQEEYGARKGRPFNPAGLWLPKTWYSFGDLVTDRGGWWLSNRDNRGSRPVSGNTDWTLVAGTPYINVTLDPVAMTTAPFKTSPGLVVIPTPGPGLVALGTFIYGSVSPGDAWNSDIQIRNRWTDQSGSTVTLDTLSLPTSQDFTSGQDPEAYAIISSSETQFNIPTVNQPVILYTPTALTGGSRSIFIRLFYTILPVTVPAIFPSVFFTISAVNQGTKTFTVSPDPTGTTGAVTVVGSTCNNGAYTVASTTATTIVVTGAIPCATADGWVKKA